MSASVLEINDLSFQYGNSVVLNDFSWTISKGEHWLIGGKSGSGKTTLAKLISGDLELTKGQINFGIDLQDSHSEFVYLVSSWEQFADLQGDRNFYYQQRYNKFAKNQTKTVVEELLKFEEEFALNISDAEPFLEAFGFENFREQQLIELSSGEHKKLQLIKALWLQPQVLIVDQLYTGLDVQARKNLNHFFDEISGKTTLILISNELEFPACITHFAEIEQGKLKEVESPKSFSKNGIREKKNLPFFLKKQPSETSETLIQMENVSVSYGEKEVLKNISWTVKSGEKWLLQGHNGSGKSTLLSLIAGDHPQAYNNGVQLFGNHRGSGESIWEIKEKIGLISPELHWYFDLNANVGQTIASGFFDSMSLYQKLDFEQQQKLEQMLYFFDLKEEKNRKLNTLPVGKQRLALLARTLVKNPEILILDEPCQGLDPEQTAYFNAVVDDVCQHGQTLIYVGHFETQLPTCIDHKLILENGNVKKNNHESVSI